MEEKRVYNHIDTDDTVLTLHDCIANKIQLENGILSFYFQNGFWITPLHYANNSSNVVRTDFSQVDYQINGKVYIYVFRKNIFRKIIRTEWTLEQLINFINNSNSSLEFLYQYKSQDEQLLKGYLRFDKAPYCYECELEIPACKIEYRWNNLCYDKIW
ncbi:MAG: hypothetical protein IKT38_02805 [Clostridia bacterium]|nr:hypothetical protein [Clostridia bacterium]MBR6509518.1 hypothetical protein [Clostridia bacterium]